MQALRYASLVLAGLLAGSELTSRLIVHPALWRLPHDAQVKAEKLMYRRFASIDPFLMTATVIACLAAAADEHGGASTLKFAAAGCFAVMLAMTLVLNMPINLAVFRFGRRARRPRPLAAAAPPVGPDPHRAGPPRQLRLRARGRGGDMALTGSRRVVPQSSGCSNAAPLISPTRKVLI